LGASSHTSARWLIIVTTAEEASGDGGDSASLNMIAIFGVGVFFLEMGGGVLQAKVRKRAK
jgi:hypothetical protein